MGIDKHHLRASGLNVDRIEEHQRNVQRFKQKGRVQTFPILDTCRIQNGGILKCIKNTSENYDASEVVSFVPAAGAASRWLAPLSDLIAAMTLGSESAVAEQIQKLSQSELLAAPLPASLRAFVEYWNEHKQLPAQWSLRALLLDIDAPKALYPAVVEGVTFLELKHMEDQAMGGLAGEIFVCPSGYKEEFRARLLGDNTPSSMHAAFEEQGLELATVRWNESGEICTDESGVIATVPAGHGALLSLLPRVHTHFPKAHSLWVRNIDNVVGTASSIVTASKNFLATHQVILDAVRRIRPLLESNDLLHASQMARTLLDQFDISVPKDATPNQVLTLVSRQMFHRAGISKDQTQLDPSHLKQLFSNIVVTMGQVPNTRRDVGGTAVFANVLGVEQKICLEVPHASAEDRVLYLEDASKATHFNPVFVAVEIPSHEQLEFWKDHPFWLVAKKSWRGQDVWYQESILYEMLGSSAYTNVTFVEIPRTLFNPHKSILDAKNRSLREWVR